MSDRKPDYLEIKPIPETAALASLDLQKVFTTIGELNSKFSFPKMSPQAKEHAEAKIRDEDLPWLGVEEQNEQIAKETLKSLRQKYAEIIDQIGLEIEWAEGLEKSPNSLQIYLADRKKFLSYLTALEGKTLKYEQKSGLQKIAERFVFQIQHQWDLADKKNEQILELFGSLANIIQEYKKLDQQGGNGLGQTVQPLEQYLDLSKKGYLKEYLLAQNANLLGNEYNFGPMVWHTDMTAEKYEARWREALQIAQAIHHNPRADEFYQRVKAHLRQSLKDAQKDLEKEIANQYYQSAPDLAFALREIMAKYTRLLEQSLP